MPTYTKDQARTHIADLVAQFKQNEAALLTTQEAMIENNFVRPLFRYLNWNVDNTGLSEPQWEFVLQRTTREGSRPDYILQLDGQHLFVMDAKKANYDMHDPRWLNQVYAYAYSTQNNAPSRKIDFAILTDFQEFVVLDCTLHAAKPQALNNFRVIDWRYPDYVARFDELWELFERNNVLAARKGVQLNAPTGIWSRYLSPKQVKANRIPPDKAFLSALDDEKTGWRVRLAKDMKRLNQQVTGEVLTAAVQLLIDRLVFVKVLSDREIEEDYLARMAQIVERAGLAENDDGWFVACQHLFGELNQMYNGSVFAPREELERVRVSNKVVRDIIGDLLPENSPYNFAVLPVEILGTIYERFLGRVVHATDARVKIEDKPEVRKAGGVYYTPQYIVNYIVQNTVGKLLAECKTPADVARLKILDPACGSGSFLLGAYDALLKWHKAYYTKLSLRGAQSATKQSPTSELEIASRKPLAMTRQRDHDAYYLDDDGRVRLTAKLKRQILLNNLFGVDIDPQAVEVTRLSLSLKALEETRAAEAHHERTLFNQTLLPELKGNIKCGNSLIGNDFSLIAEERVAVKAFDWATEFADVMSAGGFDAVIGNPPYIRIQTLSSLEIPYYSTHYKSAVGNYDAYCLFLERAITLLSVRGFAGYILPHRFFKTDYGDGLRTFLSEKQNIVEIVDFDGCMVFPEASINTCILILSGTPMGDFKFSQVQFVRRKQEEMPNVMQKITSTEREKNEDLVVDHLGKDTLSTQPWIFVFPDEQSLWKKLQACKQRLGDISTQIFQGLKTGGDAIFSVKILGSSKGITTIHCSEDAKSHKIESALVYPQIKGGEMQRYLVGESDRVIIFPYHNGKLIPEKILQTKYPLVFRYFREHQKFLESREDGKMKGAGWYGYTRTQALGSMEQSKIVTPDYYAHASYALDESGKYFFFGGGAGGYGIVLNEGWKFHYVLGLLNSKLLDWYLQKTSVRQYQTAFSYVKKYIEQLPIRTINFADAADKARHDRLVALVEQMLDLHKRLHAAQTQTDRELYQRQIDATDKQIDALVYELYGLTQEEIRIVEGK